MTLTWILLALAAPSLAVLIVVGWQAFGLLPKINIAPVYLGVATLVAIGALVAITLVAPSPSRQPTDEWASWGNDFQREFTACTGAKGNNCLVKAFNAKARPKQVDIGVVGNLYHDLRVASVLLTVPDARDTLWREFGIDNTTFIGTGYSVPMTGSNPGGYQDAHQREYFLPNFCADAIDKNICASERADVWTWRLSHETAKAWMDRPIREVLQGISPDDHTAELAPVLAQLSTSAEGHAPPRAFLRVAKFNAKYYAGTLGRPAAQRVFAADLEQVWNSQLRAEMAATGAATVIDDIKPEDTVFLWVYAPNGKSEAEVASWRAVFDYLERAAQSPDAAAASK